MSVRTYPVLVAVFLLILLAGTTASGAGREDGHPAIVHTRLFINDGVVMGDLTCDGLFSERITGTIQSGLPAVVELLYKLVTREQRMAGRGLHVLELRYDIWEDVYSVRKEDSTVHYSSFESMAGAVEHLRGIAIIPAKKIDRSGEYAVEFSIAVHPLRSREKRRIVGWVSEQMRSDDETAWHEQVLNLNDLIQHFFSRNRDEANRSRWYRTEFFNPRLLPEGGANQ